MHKASKRLRAESAILKMRLFRQHALLTAWHTARLRAAHKRALLRKALAHMRHATLPAAFSRWQQYTRVKSSLHGMAKASRQHLQRHRKHVLLIAWHAAQQRAQHKRALMSRALAFMRHAVLPAAFQSWRHYSCAQRSRRSNAESAMHRMQVVRKHRVVAAWHALQLRGGRKRELQRKALTHMRQAALSAAFTAWAVKSAWLADAHMKTLRCLQVLPAYQALRHRT